VTNLLIRMNMELRLQDNAVVYRIDGEDPGQEIRAEPVRERVADIAAQQVVRVYIVEKLRLMTKFGNLVMEGRDIGTVVFPDTPFKYYLDADPEERARRRAAEIKQQEGTHDVDAVLNSLRRRDQKDSSRATAPLQIALGAKIINSTGMTVEQVVDTIVADLKKAARFRPERPCAKRCSAAALLAGARIRLFVPAGEIPHASSAASTCRPRAARSSPPTTAATSIRR
jgi:cytidylate kinase